MIRHGKSLNRQLLVRIIIALALTWLALALIGYRQTMHKYDELSDRQMSRTIRLLGEMRTEELDELAGEASSGGMEWRLWNSSGQLVASSPHAPAVKFTDTNNRTVIEHNRAWRVHIRDLKENNRWLQLYLPLGEHQDAARELVDTLFMPLFILLPLLGGWIWLVVRKTLQPLEVMSLKIARRDPNSLAPFPEAELPAEVAPLMDTLTHLLKRQALMYERECRFTADAAHELRTPLASTQILLELATDAKTAETRDLALSHAKLAVTRASRLINQLLMLAKLDSLTTTDVAEVNISEMVRLELVDRTLDAIHKHIELSLDSPADKAMIQGNAALIEILFGNLIDNAIKYTPHNGCIQISIQTGMEFVCVRILDSGMGVPEAALPRLGDRFFRTEEEATAGSGLGLSIVRRILSLHGGNVMFQNNQPGGFVVTVNFPVRVVLSPEK